jgi:long-chain acyl-CoA synthetase
MNLEDAWRLRLQEPESPWLIDAREGFTLTVGALDLLSRQAIGFLAAHGFSAGDRLVLPTTGDIDVLVLLAGALRAGVVVALVHPDAPPSMLNGVLDVWPGARLLPAGDLASGIAESEAVDPPDVHDADADAVVVFSSGSTGPARGVRLSWRSLATGLNRLIDAAQLVAWGALMAPGTREGVAAYLHTITGYRLMVIAPLIRLTVPVVLPRAAPVPAMLELVRAYQVQIVHVGPGFIRAFVAAGDRLVAMVPPCLQAVTVGGGALPPADRRRFVELAGISLIHTYGLTETAGTCTACVLEPGGPDVAGMGVPGVPTRIVDGFIEVAPKHPASGMLDGSPVAVDGWIPTGDIGFIDADGHLHVRGRAARTFVAPSGEKVQLEDLEAVVHEVLGQECLAVVVQGRRDTIGVVVEGPVDAERAEAALAHRLPTVAVPRLWRSVDLLPRLPGGKPDLLAAAQGFLVP